MDVHAFSRGQAPDAGMTGTMRIAILATLALVAGAVWLRAHEGTSVPLPVVEHVASSVGLSPEAVPVRTGPVPSHVPEMPAEPPPSRVSAAPLPIATDAAALREAFERTPDLYDLSSRLAPAVARGEPEALWVDSRIQDYCAGFAASPAGYAQDTALLDQLGLPGANAMSRARARVAQRCGRFSPDDGITVATILQQRQVAAEAGHLAAEASLAGMGVPLEDTPEYERDLVERVRSSGDPDAYSALSTGMGIAASGRQGMSDQVAGSQFAEFAWQIAACRQGLPCGPESTLMTQYCANGGVCSRDPGQDFQSFVYDAAIPRQGAEHVDAMVDTLIQSVSRQNVQRTM
jgi:hypothetical protein